MKKMIVALALVAHLPIALTALPAYAHDQRNSQPQQQNRPQQNQPQQQPRKMLQHDNREHAPQQGVNTPARKNQGPQNIQRAPAHQNRHAQDHFSFNGHNFQKGKPAPNDYRGNRYVINDWNNRGLSAPPKDHHWSYIDGKYVLIAATTGIIAAILLSN